MKIKDLSNDQKQLIIDLHSKKYRIAEIANLLGLSLTSTRRLFDKLGLKAHTPLVFKNPNLNQKFFEEIITEDQAYWLGFIAADGCIFKNSINIVLKYSDVNHLYKFNNSLGSSNKIRDYYNGKYRCCSTSFKCKTIVQNLANFNITSKKSLVINPTIQTISHNLLHHFWRGVFDGDGFLFNKTHYNNEWIFGLCGTIGVIEQFKNFLNLDANIYKQSNIWYIKYCSLEKIKIALNKLYLNSTIYLDRKYEKYLTFKELNQ